MMYAVLDRAARARSAITPLAVSLLMWACVPAPRVSDLASGNTITEDEIGASHVFNAYEAVFKLRNEFLTSRGKLSLDPTIPPALPNVYVDRQFYGDVTSLKGIPAGTIESISFIGSSDSQYKYGRGNMAGVIDVVTKH